MKVLVTISGGDMWTNIKDLIQTKKKKKRKLSFLLDVMFMSMIFMDFRWFESVLSEDDFWQHFATTRYCILGIKLLASLKHYMYLFHLYIFNARQIYFHFWEKSDHKSFASKDVPTFHIWIANILGNQSREQDIHNQFAWLRFLLLILIATNSLLGYVTNSLNRCYLHYIKNTK